MSHPLERGAGQETRPPAADRAATEHGGESRRVLGWAGGEGNPGVTRAVVCG